MKLSYDEARELVEHVKSGGKITAAAKQALRNYVANMRGIGPRSPHTVMPDRGASPRASFGSMKGGSKSWTNR